jgi:hypothetical protein
MADLNISMTTHCASKDKGVRTVKVLEVGQLDALAHAEHIGRGAQAVNHHPDIASIQSGNLAGGVAAALNGMLNVGPGGDNGAENHQAEGKESHVGDGATEPEDLTIGDEDDGQVLEDGVDGDGEELESLGAGVDHADQQKGNREPYQGRKKTCQLNFLCRPRLQNDRDKRE